MRVTVTLDDEVAEMVRDLATRARRPIKQVVNEALRTGLSRLEQAPAARPYRTTPRRMGLRRGCCLDNIQGLIAQVEGECAR
jgi:hypothetical protein